MNIIFRYYVSTILYATIPIYCSIIYIYIYISSIPMAKNCQPYPAAFAIHFLEKIASEKCITKAIFSMKCKTQGFI